MTTRRSRSQRGHEAHTHIKTPGRRTHFVRFRWTSTRAPTQGAEHGTGYSKSRCTRTFLLPRGRLSVPRRGQRRRPGIGRRQILSVLAVILLLLLQQVGHLARQIQHLLWGQRHRHEGRGESGQRASQQGRDFTSSLLRHFKVESKRRALSLSLSSHKHTPFGRKTKKLNGVSVNMARNKKRARARKESL